MKNNNLFVKDKWIYNFRRSFNYKYRHVGKSYESRKYRVKSLLTFHTRKK